MGGLRGLLTVGLIAATLAAAMPCCAVRVMLFPLPCGEACGRDGGCPCRGACRDGRPCEASPGERSGDRPAKPAECPLCQGSNRTWTDTASASRTPATETCGFPAAGDGLPSIALRRAETLLGRDDGHRPTDFGRAASRLGRWRI